MHSIGLCTLAFIILPELDMVRGILLLSGVALVPSVLLPICASDQKSSGENAEQSTIFKFSVSALNILTSVVQFAYIPAVLVLDHFADDSRIDKETNNIVYFILSMFFVSCVYWENFVDDRFCGNTNLRVCWTRFILKAKFELQEARPIISTCTSFIKIGITLLLSWIIKAYYVENIDDDDNHKRIEKVTISEAFDKLSKGDLKRSGAIITLVLSAFIGHYVGYTACKLKLQRFSFCIPLMLSTPLAVAIAAVECSMGGVLSPFTSEKGHCRKEIETLNVLLHYICGTAVWISLFWLCRHIFHPDIESIERLPKTER
jgi:hypothetical protein